MVSGQEQSGTPDSRHTRERRRVHRECCAESPLRCRAQGHGLRRLAGACARPRRSAGRRRPVAAAGTGWRLGEPTQDAQSASRVAVFAGSGICGRVCGGAVRGPLWAERKGTGRRCSGTTRYAGEGGCLSAVAFVATRRLLGADLGQRSAQRSLVAGDRRRGRRRRQLRRRDRPAAWYDRERGTSCWKPSRYACCSGPRGLSPCRGSSERYAKISDLFRLIAMPLD
mmetsp:Transcript_78835/g.200651  ORF Transcript_78835/g.200651 Transcript_78835/m.200651 type:complete len:226 (+) Transcript_78835:370-1047(+)